MKKRIVLLSAVILFAAGSIAKADELSDLKQQMEQQNTLMQQMQQKLAQLETQQSQQSQQMDKQNQQIDQQIAKAIEEKKIEALPESLKWWIENVKFSGDFRYRYEMVEAEGDNKDTRNLNRIRARLGLTMKVTDDVEVGLRFATSEEISSENGNPTSTNQTLDDAFSKKSIWLDLAYFKWSPKDTGLNIIGGKMENPFYRVGGNQLIWDSDLTPEGIALQYTKSLGEHDEFFFNSGGFWVNEVDSADGADTGLFGVQGGLKHTFENKNTLLGGASYYSYGNVEGSGRLVSTTSFQGNSNANSLYTSDYDVAELFGEYGFKVGQMPAAAFASYVTNTAASTSEDTGWLVGGKLGKCKDPGSWEFSYDYRDLEADAVLGAFSDSDFVGGGTNGKGHRFGIAYQLAKNLQGGLNYFLDEKGSNDDSYNRLQADVTFKF